MIDPSVLVGLEIGALDRPIVTRDQGNIRFVDHVPTDELRVKYQDHDNVDKDRLVEVDYVWGLEDLKQIVGSGQRFDYVIASHVIEHVPDMVGWLREIHEVLKEDGILSLVIPDRRYTFDYLRQPSTTAQSIDAYLREVRRPTPSQVFDYFSWSVDLDLDLAWTSGVRLDQLPRKFTYEKALQEARRAQETEAYVDVHTWVFTPSSFFSIVADLIRLELFDYTIAGFFAPTVDTNEFFVTLRAVDRSGGDSDAIRHSQLATIPVEYVNLGPRFNQGDMAEQLRLLAQQQEVMNAQIDRLVDEPNSDARELRHVIDEKERRIADLTSSTSWRVTAPFRWLTSRIRR